MSEDDKCSHIHVLGYKAVVTDKEVSMEPSCYYCVRCDKTFLQLTGIFGPPVWIKEEKEKDDDT